MTLLFALGTLAGSLVVINNDANAHTRLCRNRPPNTAGNCHPSQCNDAAAMIIAYHVAGRLLIETYISNAFERYRDWQMEVFFEQNLLPAMMLMTQQLTAVGMQQMLAVGTIMDAKTQLETQRLMQEMKLRAIKDYQPSQNFCWFGTNARSLMASETRAKFNSSAYSQLAMRRHLGTQNALGAESGESDLQGRWRHFAIQNCVRTNNAWDPDNPTISGLQPACGTTGIYGERANADIAYGRVIDQARTINLNLTNGGLAPLGQDRARENDLIMLARNLYGHKVLRRNIPALHQEASQIAYLDLRAVAAKRNVAENSFAAILGLKSNGSAVSGGSAPPPNTQQYMASIMRDLGINNIDEIEQLMGDDPSYYAQLEILAKRIFQDANFYAGLYDKPQNVERTAVALRAIELMLDRAMYESRLRQEMVSSVLLSTATQKEYESVNSKLIPPKGR